MEQQQPLLRSDEKQEEESWRSYQYVGRTASFDVPVGGERVSIDEVRSASVFSDPYYPPSIHSALVASPESDRSQGQAIVFQRGYGDGHYGYTSNQLGRPMLDEVEIRQLLIDHVGHHCCWASKPARRWKISAIEDCNVYVGTLETFIEERKIVKETEPFLGEKIDGKDMGPELGLWELDLRSEFPLLFISHKESRAKVPHSEAKEKCLGCQGRGEIPCRTCNVGQEPGLYKPNQMSRCSECYGRGLIAHRDGSDTICNMCSGNGILPCIMCGSRGLIKCQTCDGQGSLLTRNIALIKWRTLSNCKVSASSGAASVPDEVFHKARGVQLYNTGVSVHTCLFRRFISSQQVLIRSYC